jgi:hypothetical protein
LLAEFKMKDLGMMHYFLGLEVWQRPDGIFLNQGKYAVEILKRFMDVGLQIHIHTDGRKLKLLSDTTSETVDATIYRTDDWFVDVLDEHEARYMFCGEHIESVHG